MALKCGHCGSNNTQAELDRYSCLDCGGASTFDGEAAEHGINDETRAVLERALEPRETNVVGNLADLQRGGAAVAEGEAKTLAVGVAETPEDTNPPRTGDEVNTTKAKS